MPQPAQPEKLGGLFLLFHLVAQIKIVVKQQHDAAFHFLAGVLGQYILQNQLKQIVLIICCGAVPGVAACRRSRLDKSGSICLSVIRDFVHVADHFNVSAQKLLII